MIKQITNYTLHIMAKSKIFWLEFALLNGMSAYLLLLQNDMQYPGVPKVLMEKIIFQLMGFTVPVFIIVVLAEGIVQWFLIEERLKGRFEYLMANKIPLKDLWIGTSMGFSIAGVFTLFSIYGVFSLGTYIMNGNVPLSKNLSLLWFAVLPFFIISILFLISALGFVVRRAKLFEFVIMASAFSFFFGSYYFLKNMLFPSSRMPAEIITPHILLGMTLIAVLSVIITFAVAKLLTPDNITLSVPD